MVAGTDYRSNKPMHRSLLFAVFCDRLVSRSGKPLYIVHFAYFRYRTAPGRDDCTIEGIGPVYTHKPGSTRNRGKLFDFRRVADWFGIPRRRGTWKKGADSVLNRRPRGESGSKSPYWPFRRRCSQSDIRPPL